MNASIRIAIISDAEMLLNWRNDQNVRKFSKSTRQISQTEHETWLKDRLKRVSNEPLFIFIIEGALAGTARLDSLQGLEKIFEVSILIDPKYQGFGYARILLDQVCEYAIRKLQAEMIFATIHNDNTKSIRLFQSAGFKYLNHDGNFIKYVKSK